MEITKKGIATKLDGIQPSNGVLAPDFSLPSIDGTTVTRQDLAGKKAIISIFPDINTRVCDLQTRRFFSLASDIPEVTIVNVSNNTLDQLTDWCATAGMDVTMLSDTELTFAKAYGLYIPEFDVLARSIFVLDENGTLLYNEIVPEMASEPNYDAAIAAATA